MKYWLGVTDNRWFNFLSQRRLDEVNFWQPTARPPFAHLPVGTPFLFKLRAPNNCIAGGGHFVQFTRLPLSLAWDVFNEKNGCNSLADLQAHIAAMTNGNSDPNPEIGCSVLTDVFYLPRENWIPAEGRFPREVVRGRTYDTTIAIEADLWAMVQAARAKSGVAEPSVNLEENRFGRDFLTHARLGQGSFRSLVIDAYNRRCAVTGETTLPVLEAAHIIPYANKGLHKISNGLLLRSDFHKLFDAGLITVEPDYKIRVSGRIRDQYFNGKAYYRLDGQQLATLPENTLDHPNPEFLRWHNNERFAA
jgi:putative restriction endonuclease